MWHHVPVPPRLDSEEMIDIVASNNNTLTIDINKGVKNQNCKVRYKSVAIWSRAPTNKGPSPNIMKILQTALVINIAFLAST